MIFFFPLTKQEFSHLEKCVYPLRLHDPSSLDLGFSSVILITDSLTQDTFWSHQWMSFLNFEELTLGVTVFLTPDLIEP